MGYQYVLFYKPYNVLSQFSPGNTPTAPAARLTLKDFIPMPGIYPVGRLDRDSEGLMLLTNHGQVQHRLSDPQFAHPRTYWVQVEHVPRPSALAQLRQGVTIKGYRTRPCQVNLLQAVPSLPPRHPPIRHRQRIPTAWLEMTLHEGKNRQVRRMTAAVGHPTLRLVRIAIAHLTLDHLQPGQWRLVTPSERQRLLQI
ncbi:pseudouridine synthase [Nodosilinea sp. LEGE 07088]|uniref:pseudouridine synthase n=1 Tax=Nodosilinea sp. LEGE 07088 TaxID=2777968 RepID=UPI00187EBC8A|nr:pseudouridine synthase [Nodosilinea sp. LEGE 07088]MBE9138296.1 pseudouridine synthase [Nodosilinea sp. LEGE 07088]